MITFEVVDGSVFLVDYHFLDKFFLELFRLLTCHFIYVNSLIFSVYFGYFPFSLEVDMMGDFLEYFKSFFNND
jgi:hypothetical protein